MIFLSPETEAEPWAGPETIATAIGPSSRPASLASTSKLPEPSSATEAESATGAGTELTCTSGVAAMPMMGWRSVRVEASP